MLMEKAPSPSIAASVLKRSTIEEVRCSSSYHLPGWEAVDRLAFYKPAELLILEDERKVILLGCLTDHKYLEHSTLNSTKFINLKQQGTEP